MPSQRLLKMLDPRGHVGQRVLDMRDDIAVVWASSGVRTWIANELTAAGMTPLLATAFRHVATSLHPSASPQASVAVLDFDMLGVGELSQLVTLRWNGFRGRIIALSRAGMIDPRTHQLASVDAVIKPDGARLRAAVARPNLP